ncbi:MAG: hypothetical protein Q8R36_04075 [bacterium]|nr:hypothetical protein [bacterium]
MARKLEVEDRIPISTMEKVRLNLATELGIDEKVVRLPSAERVTSKELSLFVEHILELLRCPGSYVNDTTDIMDCLHPVLYDDEPERARFLQRFVQQLGFPVSEGDVLADVAEKLKEKSNKREVDVEHILL